MKKHYILALLLFLPISGQGALIGIGDFSGSETIVDFTGISASGSAPITVGELTVDSPNSDLVIGPDIFGVWAETPLATGGDHLSDRVTSTNTNLEFSFLNPINRVGMWINGGNTATSWTFTAFDSGGGVVGSHLIEFALFDGYPDPSTFAGIEFSSAFVSLTIMESSANRQYTGIDDVRFEAASPVPVPAALWLFGPALIALVGFSKRRKTA